MRYNPRCSKCGEPLPAITSRQQIIDGQQVERQTRPGWGQVRYSIKTPVEVEPDGMGFNEYMTARLASLQLPLCLRVEDSKLTGCFVDLIEVLEGWWDG